MNTVNDIRIEPNYCQRHPHASMLTPQEAGNYPLCAGCAIEIMRNQLVAKFNWPQEVRGYAHA